MGFSIWFFVEVKSFEFAIKEVSVLRIFKRSMGVFRFFGKSQRVLVVGTMEALSQAEPMKEFEKSSRGGLVIKQSLPNIVLTVMGVSWLL